MLLDDRGDRVRAHWVGRFTDVVEDEPVDVRADELLEVSLSSGRQLAAHLREECGC